MKPFLFFSILLCCSFWGANAQEFEKTIFTDLFITEIPDLLPEQLQKYEQNLQKSIGTDFQYTKSSFLKRIEDKDAKAIYKGFLKKKNFKGNSAIFWKPHHAMYFVNQGEIVYVVLLCLECNKTISYPNLKESSSLGLTPKFHLYLRSILNKYQFHLAY